jgi:hypothetical protein
VLDWLEENPEYTVEYARKIKTQVFEHYSGSPPHCGCGEKRLVCLTLSHVGERSINEVAEAKRTGRRVMAGMPFYKWLLKHKFPVEVKVIVECLNCNVARDNWGSE